MSVGERLYPDNPEMAGYYDNLQDFEQLSVLYVGLHEMGYKVWEIPKLTIPEIELLSHGNEKIGKELQRKMSSNVRVRKW